jgi:undecaprenyl-diphosphatase
MDFFQVLILSIVEGITEFLPISSTGHLILTAKILQIPQTDFVKTFEITIQLGAILSVFILFWKKILTDFEVLKRVVWVFLPTGVLGFVLYKLIKESLIGNLLITVLSLIIGGVIIILIEKMVKTEKKLGMIKDLTLSRALILGVIQTLSVIPGVSRSATTIFGGMLLGLSRKEATELSFLVAVPVMAGATGYDLYKSWDSILNSDLAILGLGILVSFITATLAIKWLIKYVSHHNFIYFGIYRIIVGLLFLIFFT